MGNENLEQGNTALVESMDNSQADNANLDEQIAKALEEPVTEAKETSDEAEVKEPTKEIKQDNITECPEKFRNKDGSVNVENLVKSYKELESNSSQKQTEWEKERAEHQKVKEKLDSLNKIQEEQARQSGFDSHQDMQNAYELVSLEANEYYKYINETDDPVAVTKMLQEYLQFPSDEKLRDIELEFSPVVIREVAKATERRKIQLEQQSQQFAQTTEMTKIENTIQQLCEKHNEILQDSNVKDFVVSQFTKFGANLDFDTASGLLTLLESRDSSMKEKYNDIATKQNSQATDKIAAISNSSSATNSDTDNYANFGKLSSTEQEKLISKYL